MKSFIPKMNFYRDFVSIFIWVYTKIKTKQVMKSNDRLELKSNKKQCCLYNEPLQIKAGVHELCYYFIIRFTALPSEM